MTKKWSDPLEKLLAADEKAHSVKEYLKNISLTNHENINFINQQPVIEIDTKQIIKWKHKDRPDNELGNIEELAKTFKLVGQQQPCIVRTSIESSDKFELIVGERRWRAAELAGLKVKAIIQNIDDKTATLIQAIENEKRSDLSDFAKGMSYSDKIEKGLITQKDLIDILGISKQQVTRLLSYKKIPSELFVAIGDFRKVSSRTAYELARLANKNELNLKALIKISEEIRAGKAGQRKIYKILESLDAKTKDKINNKKIIDLQGKTLFTWTLSQNHTPCISFSNYAASIFIKDKNKSEQLIEELKKWIDKNLN